MPERTTLRITHWLMQEAAFQICMSTIVRQNVTQTVLDYFRLEPAYVQHHGCGTVTGCHHVVLKRKVLAHFCDESSSKQIRYPEVLHIKAFYASQHCRRVLHLLYGDIRWRTFPGTGLRLQIPAETTAHMHISSSPSLLGDTSKRVAVDLRVRSINFPLHRSLFSVCTFNPAFIIFRTLSSSILQTFSMALLQEAYHGLDPLTLSAIIEIQLEDSAALAGLSKGKQREGTIRDAELALQILTEDLRACRLVLEDRSMARSMALAVHRDGELISRAHQQDDQIARDRQMAASLMQGPDSPAEHHTGQVSTQQQEQAVQDPWEGNEMLEKAAALYNHDSIPNASASVCNEYGANEDDLLVQPESSAWGASRAGKAQQKLGHCVACGDTKAFFDVARVPCDHEYCRECLANLFEASMRDESLFPPRCDGQPIPLDQVRFFLPVDLAREFEERSVELSTNNRVYCHDPRCSTFIPPPASVEHMEGDWLRCPSCDKTTCTICKAAAHAGDCPDDTALQQLIDTAGDEQWQRCYQCHRFIELEQGCNHMTWVNPSIPLRILVANFA